MYTMPSKLQFHFITLHVIARCTQWITESDSKSELVQMFTTTCSFPTGYDKYIFRENVCLKLITWSNFEHFLLYYINNIDNSIVVKRSANICKEYVYSSVAFILQYEHNISNVINTCYMIHLLCRFSIYWRQLVNIVRQWNVHVKYMYILNTCNCVKTLISLV